MLFTSFFLLISACDYVTGFAKARDDMKSRSYGYNIDKYCFGDGEDSRGLFRKGYDDGRVAASKLEAGHILENPRNSEHLTELLTRAEMVTLQERQRIELDQLKSQIEKMGTTVKKLEDDALPIKEDVSQSKIRE